MLRREIYYYPVLFSRHSQCQMRHLGGGEDASEWAPAAYLHSLIRAASGFALYRLIRPANSGN